jgi:transposase
MGKMVQDDGWRLPEELWVRMEPLLPERPPHPLGCHNPRVPDRSAMDAIFFVLRTGSQWQALRATGICSPSSAYRRFREWAEAGVFEAFWRAGLLAYDGLVGIDWGWLSVDGAMTKAPLGGEKNRTQPDRPRQNGHQALVADRWPRPPARPRGRWRERGRLQNARAHP